MSDEIHYLKSNISTLLNGRIEKAHRRNIANSIHEALRNGITMPHFDITTNTRTKIWK
jgi:hypothetical protein